MRSGTTYDHLNCRHGARLGNTVQRSDGLGWDNDLAEAHNPAEEAPRRIAVQATCVVAFAVCSAVMAMQRAATSYEETVVLWSMWMATTTYPMHLLVFLAAGCSQLVGRCRMPNAGRPRL